LESYRIEGVDLVLTHPDELDIDWVGQGFVQEQLLAAWMRLDEADLALSPRILGRPGVGKTSLAYATGRQLGREVYIVQATMDTRPEDLLVTPVLAEQGKLRYHASGLVTAMIRGGICVLDEGNRMTEKSWASLAPLLDARRYVESIVAGIKIHAHQDFLFCATMNEDASTFEIPEYIHSRLQPRIVLDFPARAEELAILRSNLPQAEEQLLAYLADFLQKAHRADERYAVRDGINIGRFALKILRAQSQGEMGEIPDAAVSAPPSEPRPGGPRAEVPPPGRELESWFRTALEEVLDPTLQKLGAAKKAPVKAPRSIFGGKTPGPPKTPTERALAHATRQVLGEEALGYLPPPGSGAGPTRG
jgi:hypothetical protein